MVEGKDKKWKVKSVNGLTPQAKPWWSSTGYLPVAGGGSGLQGALCGAFPHRLTLYNSLSPSGNVTGLLSNVHFTKMSTNPIVHN